MTELPPPPQRFPPPTPGMPHLAAAKDAYFKALGELRRADTEHNQTVMLAALDAWIDARHGAEVIQPERKRMARRTTTDTSTNGAAVRPGRKPANGIKVTNDGTVTRTRTEHLGTVEKIQLDTGLNRWFHGSTDHIEQRRGVGYKTGQEAAQALADHIDKATSVTFPDLADDMETV